jgi:NADH dehydrogenase FAD-containing subunit
MMSADRSAVTTAPSLHRIVVVGGGAGGIELVTRLAIGSAGPAAPT